MDFKLWLYHTLLRLWARHKNENPVNLEALLADLVALTAEIQRALATAGETEVDLK